MNLKMVNDTLENQITFLHSILDSIPYVVYVKDLDSKYVYANKFCLEANNCNAEDFYGKTDGELFPLYKIGKIYKKNDENLIKNRKGFISYVPIPEPEEFTYSYLREEPLFDKENNVCGILGFIITPQIKISRRSIGNIQIFNDKDKYMFFDYLCDQDLFVILKSIPELDFLNSIELKSGTVFNSGLIYKEDISKVLDIYERLMKGESPVHFLLRMYDKENKLNYYNFEACSLKNEEGIPVRFLCSLKHLTEEFVRSENFAIEVENAKKHIYSVLNNYYDICLFADPDFNAYEILYANENFSDFDKKGEWNSFIDIMYQKLHQKDYGILKNIFLSLNLYGDDEISSRQAREFRYADKNGEYRWKSFSVVKPDNSNTAGFLLYFSDVTDAVKEREQRNLKNMNSELIDVLSTIVEFRDMESGEHVSRIKEFTRLLLKQVNKVYTDRYYSSEMIGIISTASALHDIGKIAIPDHILLKPGKLTAEEFEEMKLHTVRGCEILKTMPRIQEENYYKYSYEICRYHHERYDGKGYPDKLVGENIPLEAQIVSVADVFDALTSKRCYKPPYDYETALKMINNGECGAFSSRLLECLNLAKDEMIEYAKKTNK